MWCLRKQTKWHRSSKQSSLLKKNLIVGTLQSIILWSPSQAVEMLIVRSLRYKNYDDAWFQSVRRPWRHTNSTIHSYYPPEALQSSSTTRGQVSAMSSSLGWRGLCCIMHKNECRIQDISSYISTTLKAKKAERFTKLIYGWVSILNILLKNHSPKQACKWMVAHSTSLNHKPANNNLML